MSATSTQTAAVSASINDATMVLTLTFKDGRTLDIDALSLNEDIRNAALLHGLKQKLVDAAAIGRDTETGRSATLSDKYEAVREVYDRITGPVGTWNKIRAAGDGVQSGGLLVRAIMQLSGKAREEVVAQLDAMSKEQRTALRANKRVAEVIATFKDTSDTSDELLASIIGD